MFTRKFWLSIKMRIFFCSISFLVFNFISFSQVKEFNTNDTQKEKVLNNSTEKPLNQRDFRRPTRINTKEKIKQLPRKENYEPSPKDE